MLTCRVTTDFELMYVSVIVVMSVFMRVMSCFGFGCKLSWCSIVDFMFVLALAISGFVLTAKLMHFRKSRLLFRVRLACYIVVAVPIKTFNSGIFGLRS